MSISVINRSVSSSDDSERREFCIDSSSSLIAITLDVWPPACCELYIV